MAKVRCEICDRTFKNEDSLAMHNEHKHPEKNPNKSSTNNTSLKLNKNTKNYFVFGVITVLIIAGLFWLVSSVASEGSEYTEFAKCLTNSGVKNYGAFWCPNCLEQKAMFGQSWKEIEYIECSNRDRTQKPVCDEAQITGYPTWEFPDGQRLTGLQSFLLISQYSDCPLPS